MINNNNSRPLNRWSHPKKSYLKKRGEASGVSTIFSTYPLWNRVVGVPAMFNMMQFALGRPFWWFLSLSNFFHAIFIIKKCLCRNGSLLKGKHFPSHLCSWKILPSAWKQPNVWWFVQGRVNVPRPHPFPTSEGGRCFHHLQGALYWKIESW